MKCSTVLQMEAVECGAASLAMVLTCFGRFVPLEELRIECGVSRDGSKASNILKAARRYGLVAKGFKQELNELYNIQLPAILFWEFNHFVVLEGFHKGKVLLNDPAEGPRNVTLEELDQSFSGVVLTFEKGPGFKPGGERPNLLAALRRRLEGSETALFFVILCGLFLVIPGLAIPTFARIFIDEYLVAQKTDLIQPLLIGMALTAVVSAVLTFLQRHYLLRLQTRIAISSSTSFFNHVLRLPTAYFSQRFAGEIGSRVMINNRVAGLVSGRLATTTLSCLLIVFYAALMFFYDVTLTVLCIIVGSLNLLALKWVSNKRTDASRKLLQEEGKLVGTAMGGLQTLETLKATGSEGEFFSRWSGHQARALRSQQDLARLGHLVAAVPGVVNTLATALILFLGGLKVMNGELTVGMLVAYQTLMIGFSRPLNDFVGFGSELQELEADMGRLDDVLNHREDSRFLVRNGGSDSIVKLSGAIDLKDVTFGYSPLEPPLLERFSLQVKPGQRVALVGASGSGKSTVARLIAGLYDPWDGEVRFDGIPRARLSPDLISNSLGVVDQEIILFGATIRDNLSMWDSTVPDRNITLAARDAAIDEVIETRDGAYYAQVTESGANFSGGQRQRLEIARALVGAPTMLILDEATSALDPSTELEIDEALRRRGCTCVIVAHRLSTIRDCDEIIVMDQGAIVQQGTHEELLRSGRLYSELIRN